VTTNTIISSQKCSVQLFVWPLRRPPPQGLYEKKL
jgi:hypothetical protein